MAREYVAIRLPPDLLKWIDKHVDGTRIKNRTHFIEIVLTDKMNSEKK